MADISACFEIKTNSTEPLYRQIGSSLRRYIDENSLVEGDRMPELATIAKLAGVSIRTAYIAMQELIKQGICYKRPKNGCFVGAKPEAGLRTMCGIYSREYVFSQPDVIHGCIFKGISRLTDQNLISPVLFSADPETNIRFYQGLAGVDFTGVVMLAWQSLEEGVRLAEKFPQLRFVYVNYEMAGFDNTPENVYGVFNDDFGGGYQICQNAVSQGGRNVRILTVETGDLNYKNREEGMLAALRDNNLPASPRQICSGGAKGNRTLEEIGGMLAAELFTDDRKPDTLLCTNDLLAQGALEWLNGKGISDVKVTGYDNLFPSLGMRYGISTVAVDFEKMGEKAVATAASRKRTPKTIRIMPRVMMRDIPKIG
jgi:DNA-binding LacI/PurR family transcriptional regulator